MQRNCNHLDVGFPNRVFPRNIDPIFEARAKGTVGDTESINFYVTVTVSYFNLVSLSRNHIEQTKEKVMIKEVLLITPCRYNSDDFGTKFARGEEVPNEYRSGTSGYRRRSMAWR